MNRSFARAGSGRGDGPRGAVAGSDALPDGDAALDDLGELTLLLGVEQRHGADLVQVLTNRIAHDGCSNSAEALTIPAERPHERPDRQVASR
ncbi:MAG: hypothetical protein R2701_08765 [Acidimicrobiales bacterium]